MKHKVINQKDLPYQFKIMYASKEDFLYLKVYLFALFYKIKIK